MKRCIILTLALCYFCLAVPQHGRGEDAQGPDITVSELTVVNLTGQPLTLTIDGGESVDITTTISIAVQPGEHDFLLAAECGPPLPRHQIFEAGQGYTWTISHAPACQ